MERANISIKKIIYILFIILVWAICFVPFTCQANSNDSKITISSKVFKQNTDIEISEIIRKKNGEDIAIIPETTIKLVNINNQKEYVGILKNNEDLIFKYLENGIYKINIINPVDLKFLGTSLENDEFIISDNNLDIDVTINNEYIIKPGFYNITEENNLFKVSLKPIDEFIVESQVMPKMTGDTTNGVTVTSDNVYNNMQDYAGWQIFNEKLNEQGWSSNHNKPEANILFEFPENKSISSLSIYEDNTYVAYAPTDFEFYGSTDNQSWELLTAKVDYQITNGNEWYKIILDRVGSYRYYKLHISKSKSTTYSSITEMKLNEDIINIIDTDYNGTIESLKIKAIIDANKDSMIKSIRTIIVPTEDAENFTIKQAINLSNEEYCEFTTEEVSNGVNFNANQKDINGESIVLNKQYKVFILAVPQTEYIPHLSSYKKDLILRAEKPSSPIITLSTIQKTVSVTINAVYSNNSAQKLYRVDMGEWKEYEEDLLITENCIIEFKGVNSEGVESNIRAVQITNIVNKVQNVEVEISSDYINSQALNISFIGCQDETKVDEYCIYIVPETQWETYDYEQARLDKGSGSAFTKLIAMGEGNKEYTQTLKADMVGVDLLPLASNKRYKIFVVDFGSNAIGYGEFSEEFQFTKKSIIPTMTAPTTDGVTMSTNSEYSSSYQAFNAADGKYTGEGWCSKNGEPNSHLQIEFDTEKTIIEYGIYINATVKQYYVPVSWVVYGSNDGTNWDIIDTKSDEIFQDADKLYKFSVDTPNSYKFYKIDIVQSSSAEYIGLAEIEMYE